MLATTPKGVVQKVSETMLDAAASGLDTLYETVWALPRGVQPNRVDQQLAVLSSTSLIANSIIGSIKKPQSRLNKALAKAGENGYRLLFLKLLVGGLSQRCLLKHVMSITNNQPGCLPDWLKVMEEALRKNCKKKGSKYPYIDNEDAVAATVEITADWHSDTNAMGYACDQLGITLPVGTRSEWQFQPEMLTTLTQHMSNKTKALVKLQLTLSMESLNGVPHMVGREQAELADKHDLQLHQGPVQLCELHGPHGLLTSDLRAILTDDEVGDTYTVEQVEPGVLLTDISLKADADWWEGQMEFDHPSYHSLVTYVNEMTSGLLLHDLYLSTILGKTGEQPTARCPLLSLQRCTTKQGNN
jgi:hypothetical protein